MNTSVQPFLRQPNVWLRSVDRVRARTGRVRSALTYITCTLLAAAAAIADAQTPGLFERIPEVDYRDVNDVDGYSGALRFSRNLISIGNNARPLSLGIYLSSPVTEYGHVETWCPCNPLALGQLISMGLTSHVSMSNDDEISDLMTNHYGFTRAVKLPQQSARFSFWSNPAQSTIPDGSQLSLSGSQFLYTGRDGTQAVVGPSKISGYVDYHFLVSEVTYPDGEKWTYRYNEVTYPGTSEKVSRLRSIVSSRGYGIQLSYEIQSLWEPRSYTERDRWMSVVRATVYNKAQVACDETQGLECLSVLALPSAVTFAYDRPNGVVSITAPGQGTTQLHFAREPAYGYLELRSIANPVPGSAKTITYYHNEDSAERKHHVWTVTVGGVTWRYAHFTDPLPGPEYVGSWDEFHTYMNIRIDPSPQLIAAITGKLGSRRVSSVAIGSSYTDRIFNTYRSPTSVTLAEGNQVSISYDARNNPVTITETPKPGSPAAARITRAGFPTSCVSMKTCNQPEWIRDAAGNQTDYVYSPDHGGVLTVTGPAVNGVRPQKRYSYAQRYAWAKNGAGSYVQSAAPIWVLAQESYCRTSAAAGGGCSAGDEVVTQYEYGPNAGPNNLLLRGIAVTADAQTLRTCYAYDDRGNRISETLPRAELTSCP